MGIGCSKHYIIMTNRPKDPGLKVTSYIRKYLEDRGGPPVQSVQIMNRRSRSA